MEIIEFEHIVKLLTPDLECKGVSRETIREIEQIADEKLPEFYKWFLSNMCLTDVFIQEMGIDFSPLNNLKGNQIIPPELLEAFSPHHIINIGTIKNFDINGDAYLYYDVKKVIRNDAPVIVQFDIDYMVNYETLREMLTHRLFLAHKYHKVTHKKSGHFIARTLEKLEVLDDFIRTNGASSLISNTTYFRLYQIGELFVCLQIDVDDFLKYQVCIKITGNTSSEVKLWSDKIAKLLALEIK